MAQNNVLRWQDGRGWLVLSGGAAVESEIRARVIERNTADGGVAYISVNVPEGSAALDDMSDLGAPTGYQVDILTEDDNTIFKSLSEAGIVVLEDTQSPADLRSGLQGAALTGIKAAFERGAMILAEGNSAALTGSWVALHEGSTLVGLDWVKHGVILPRITSIAESKQAQAIVDSESEAIIIGIGWGSALALGPNGEVETWGERQVTLALGRAYQ
jgi:hypothetical protein